MKTLSIIMGLYNSAEFMAKSIESLVEQDISREELEILLINDCSPDNSLEVAEQYAKKYPECIKVISHSVNKGLAGARNTGLDNATGKYVTFTDPDDYVVPNAMKQIIDKMEQDNLDVLRFDYYCVNEQGVEIPKPKEATKVDCSPCVMSGKEFIAKRLGYGCFVWPFFYRLDLINKHNIRLIQGLYFDDTEWLPKVLYEAERVGCLPVKRYYYVQREGSLTHLVDPEKQKKMAYALLDVVSTLKNDSEMYDDAGVLGWYRSMWSFVAFSSISTVINYDCFNDLISKYKSINAFPLKIDESPIARRIKLSLLNRSPFIYKCFAKVISLKHK